MMEIRHIHPWNVSVREAIQIQRRLRVFIELNDMPDIINYIAGTDISSSKRSDQIWAGVLIFSYPQLIKLEERWVEGKMDFPYIPGLLSFREIPLLLEAFKQTEVEPDLIFCDGQGIAHPRGMGLASHLGLMLNKPTIGCAKSRLIGGYSKVGNQKGAYSLLHYKGNVVGVVLRTRTGVKPLFVSPGHKITLDKSIKMVLSCCIRYRIPEPIRQTHLMVKGLSRIK